MAHTVTFIPGDGTGPELAEATRRVLEATGVEFNWDRREAGIDEYERSATPSPTRRSTRCAATASASRVPTTTPVGSGFRSVNVLLRKELDLYACIRPCKAYEGVRTRFPETDIVIVRENTEDLYAGIEFEKGTPEAAQLRADLERLGAKVREDAGISIKPISVFGSERIVRARLRVRAGQRAAQGHRRPQGQHHEVLRRPVPRGRAPGRRGLRGHRVRGLHHRQPLQPARIAPGGLRRHRRCPTSTATSSPTWARG